MDLDFNPRLDWKLISKILRAGIIAVAVVAILWAATAEIRLAQANADKTSLAAELEETRILHNEANAQWRRLWLAAERRADELRKQLDQLPRRRIGDSSP